MNLEKLLKENRIKKQTPDFNQIGKQLIRVQKDIDTAKKNINIDTTWSYTIAYHSMIRAARALMYSKGYLPTAQNSHKTIVEFAKMILGVEYEELTNRFNRMRRRRHDFVYDSINHISQKEAEDSIIIAERFLEKILEIVKKENPQMYF